MKQEIIDEIIGFTGHFQEERCNEPFWRRPLIGFASACDPMFMELKTAVSPSHAMPEDLLPGAQTVAAFFIPFDRSIIRSNIKGLYASHQWAEAYIQTNELISELGLHLGRCLESAGHAVALIPATHNFDPERLISDWSHRHVAFVAGLGSFGLNNMLITESGCCGRIGSLVTSAFVEPDLRPTGEACLYCHDSSCMMCVERCVNEALFTDRFYRQKCYAACLKNEKLFQNLGKADVCGKCLVGVPCSFTNPVRRLKINNQSSLLMKR
ncbi:MAG TPA: epoxyqueuosine reductase [Desulfobacteraceae bacterium]|nr:epoxyqueuosine reductase [Desulfobacteraceae bacterium]